MQMSNGLRKMPEAPAKYAKKSVTLPAPPPAVKGVPLDLKALVAPYRDRKKLTLRVENLAQAARLSAGQNNGDRTWSLSLDDLDDLLYLPSETGPQEQLLSVRVVARDDTGATTLAVIEVPVSAAGARLPKPAERRPESAPKAVSEEITQLKALLAEREESLRDLNRVLAEAEDSARKMRDAALAAAEAAWRKEEAQKAAALKAGEAERDARLAEQERRLKAEAAKSLQQSGGAALQLQQKYVQAQAALEKSETENTRLKVQLDCLKQEVDAQLAALRGGEAERLKLAEKAWRDQAAKSLGEAAARLEAAEAALSSVKAAANAEQDAEIRRLKTELAQLQAKNAGEAETASRRMADAEQAVTRGAAQLAELARRCESAERALAQAQADRSGPLKDAEIQRLKAELAQQREISAAEILARQAAQAAADRAKAGEREAAEQSAAVLAAMTARCEKAEAALVSLPAAGADHAHWQSELARLRAEAESRLEAQNRGADEKLAQALKVAEAQLLERAAREQAALAARCQQAESERDAAQRAAEQKIAAAAKAAEAQAQERAAKASAELSARCEQLEAALAAARDSAPRSAENDGYIRGLTQEIKALQAALVDREAEIGRLNAALEEMRGSTVAKAPPVRWEPLSNRDPEPEPEEERPAYRGWVRDGVIVFVVVVAGFLLYPQILPLLPYDVQVALAGASGDNAAAPAAPRPTLPPKPKPAPVFASIRLPRNANVRTEAAPGAALLVALKRDSVVTVLEKKGNWTHVRFAEASGKNQEGWVFSSFLAPPEKAAAAVKPVAPSVSATSVSASGSPESIAAPAPAPAEAAAPVTNSAPAAADPPSP
jgi:hypothetical protein